VSQRGAIDLKASALDSQATDANCFADVALADAPIDPDNPFLYHKTTNRRVYDEALASRPGASDVLLFNQRRELTESTIANLVVELDGVQVTPPIECGLLPGTARRRLLEQGTVRERVIHTDELARATRVYLVNSVRGMHEISLPRELTLSSAAPRPCKEPSDTG
jgi:para-aminobenzoate synthetase/4-amino-4-deoxychorismate lyase